MEETSVSTSVRSSGFNISLPLNKKVLKDQQIGYCFSKNFFKIVSCLILFNLAVVNTSLSNICLWYMDNINIDKWKNKNRKWNNEFLKKIR